MGTHPLSGALRRRGLNPIKIAHNPRRPAPLTASAFTRLCQCANSPGNRVYCYAELAVSSLAVAITIASTHYAYPRRDGQAELSWMAGLNTKMVYLLGTETRLSVDVSSRQKVQLEKHLTFLRSSAE